MWSTSCEMSGYMSHKKESRLLGELSIPQICRWHQPYDRNQRETKEPLDETESREWRSWLKTQHSKDQDHGSGPITSWQIDGETMKIVTDFIFFSSKITADGDWSHEIKRHLLLGRNLWQPRQHIKKQRHYFANKGPSSQGYGFPSGHVWMWELDHKESWAQENWSFWTIFVVKLLRVPWIARKSNQSILKEISPEYSLEGLMLKLKFQYFDHMVGRGDSLEKTLMLGKIEGRRRKGWQRMR